MGRIAAMMTAPLTGPSYKHGRAICGDCRGKGFDCTRGNGARSARMCQRCRGRGFTLVGGTKR